MKRFGFLACLLVLSACLSLIVSCSNGQGDDDSNSSQDDDATDWNNDDSIDEDVDDDTTNDPYEIDWQPVVHGYFRMGCVPGDALCQDDEKPQHWVLVPSRYIARTPTTQHQFESVMGYNPSYFVPENGYPDCPNCPVESVDWSEAETFCEALGGSLPTEAQWEYAVRGFSKTAYFCGPDSSCLADVAWYAANSDGRTHPVLEKRANHFALYDAVGNVNEWVYDWYAPDSYPNHPIGDPQGPETGELRVVRGGGWDSEAPDLRSSARFAVAPDQKRDNLGFRCTNW